MVTVPPKTTAVKGAHIEGHGKRDIYMLPEIDAKSDKKTLLPVERSNTDLVQQPHLWMSANKNLSVLFVVVLLLVVVITNIPLRGLWSVIVIVLVVSITIIFALLEWWETILHYVSFLDIRINAAGYLVISLTLFALWLVVMLLFDRQLYIVFTPGQMRVCLEIGDAETAYDTTGMTVQKQRSDLFRHWILGLGSGDLIVRTSGANAHEFHLPNVLFIGRKVKEIEDLLRQKQVVTGAPQA
jgi:FlaA1/EpsC-like NDP-sugar epimerase